MNAAYISKLIRPFVRDNKLTYDDFDKIFGFLPRKEQYSIADTVQDDLNIELVDEIEELPQEDASAEDTALIVREPREIRMPNKLLIRMIQDGDEQARQDLCVKNRGLVDKFAFKYWKRFPDKLDLEDLLQEGNIGLITAAERFDFSKNTEFSTYATWWIVQKIMRAIADTGLAVRLPVYLVQKILKASGLDRHFQTQDIELRERLELIAREMDTTSEEIRRLFKLRDIYFRLISLDTPVGVENDTPLADFIPDERSTLEDDVELVILREQIDDILSTLTEREQDVLKLRYGLEDGKERTLEEVGKIFNVTRERIRQIEAKALRKLRHPARSKKLRDFLD